MHSLGAALVYTVRASDVDSTIVDGRVLMRDRQLLTLDKAAIKREVAARSKRFGQRKLGKQIQTYRTES